MTAAHASLICAANWPAAISSSGVARAIQSTALPSGSLPATSNDEDVAEEDVSQSV